MLAISCPHCQSVVQGDLDQEWTYKLCFCGEQILRQAFLDAMVPDDIPSAPKNWDEENARSLRSIAVSFQVLALGSIGEPEDNEVPQMMGALAKALVAPFED